MPPMPVVSSGQSVGISVRLGKVENTGAAEADDFALRVFLGRRVGSISANAGSDMKMLAERAVAMAKVAPEDPWQELAPKELLATELLDLDQFDSTDVASAELTRIALEMEDAALCHQRDYKLGWCQRQCRFWRYCIGHFNRLCRLQHRLAVLAFRFCGGWRGNIDAARL